MRRSQRINLLFIIAEEIQNSSPGRNIPIGEGWPEKPSISDLSNAGEKYQQACSDDPESCWKPVEASLTV